MVEPVNLNKWINEQYTGISVMLVYIVLCNKSILLQGSYWLLVTQKKIAEHFANT